MMKKNEIKLLQNHNDTYIQFKELVRTYIELENTLKTLKEKGDNKSS